MEWESFAMRQELGLIEARSFPITVPHEWQLPLSSDTMEPELDYDPNSDPYSLDMASLAATGGSSSSNNNNNKQIPLLCSVCPETPRFSDVSHLLTHIASKGHLHHETQTKLRAHQDLSASVALQQYEQWYKENGIEALLVERMKAKQLKEAVRSRRSRGASNAAPSKQSKRKPRRSAAALDKSENEPFAPDFAIYPGFFASDNEPEMPDDFLATGDMMALKGQVWPGMGKMDLANEDMKRTRNQRKPKSVIERMRRTSEGIEPTQVVMTPEFEVERIKDVYDSSSPVPDQEEATPQKKTAKPRRKRPEPLAEVSANIPRGTRRSTRGNPVPEKRPKANMGLRPTPSSDITPSVGRLKRGFDVFRDEDAVPGVIEDRHVNAPSHREAKFDLHGRNGGLRQLNSMSHSNVISPTPTSRDIPDRMYSARDMGRGRNQGQSFMGINSHFAMGQGSVNHQEMAYTLHEPSMYANPARMSLGGGTQFGTMDQFHMPPTQHAPPKYDDYSNVGPIDPMNGPVANHFLHMSGPNPLFSHDRLFMGSCGQPVPSANFPSLGFTPINRHREPSRQNHNEQDRQTGTNGVKLEPQLCEVLDGSNVDEAKETSFDVNDIWGPQAPEDDTVMADGLQHEGLEI